MADRVSASIVIGGQLPSHLTETFIAAIEDEGLSLDYVGEPFEAHQLVSGEPLSLCAHEVAWGTFNILEAFCRENKLAYSRWFGCCLGAWGSGRSVYRGVAETREGEAGVDDYDASDDNQLLMGVQLAKHLGSYEAIIAHFERGDFRVPPLRLIDVTNP